ncbi:hypothetical protein [Accumulibacter sp.]|uniref:hypothetical protein n=1 Tax=Accumulibacter sp. TaxID=2053492 RepID=UPI00260CA627|nr:hypothetical protein [Accumulibacter sp.]
MGKNEITGETVEISVKDGVAFIEQASPLTRLHYFDGQFLRADAFALEQDYHRTRTRLANLAGGWGVVHGMGIAVSGADLRVGAGLAVTAAGNFVLATAEMQTAIADLLAGATPAPASGNAELADCLATDKGGVKESSALAIYEITVGPVEGQCGNEPVFGKLCESACASDARHPWWREGVVLRLRPIKLLLPASSAVATSHVHLRNRVASAYFAAEPWLAANALSAAGLASGIWCEPAGLYGRDEVVIGLLVREAGVNRVLDAWSGRRERMDTQARGYWQGRLAMRPWNVFVAQILQFQCQLSSLFDAGSAVVTPAEDCAELRLLLDRTRQELEALHKRYRDSAEKIVQSFGDKPSKKGALEAANEVKLAYAELYDLSSQLAEAELGKGALPAQRMLINAGFVELPPAGYLPVSPGKTALEEQLARMFGEGVRLHYHAVRADEIAHLLSEAQHLQRLSLTRGIDHPGEFEEVEIFVPDGQVVDLQRQAAGTWWQVDMRAAALTVFDFGSLESKTEAAAAVDAAPAPAPAAPAAAAAPDENAYGGAPAEVAEKAYDRVDNPLLALTLSGMARSETRDDGSYGLTLTTSAEPQEVSGLEFKREQKLALEIGRYSVYLAGDVGGDPFDLGLGGALDVKAELRVIAGRRGTVATLTGELTVLSRKFVEDYVELLVQMDMIASSTMVGGTETRKPDARRSTLRLTLLRRGDGDAGSFILDDQRHDPSNSPVFIDWQESPRRAVLSVSNSTEAKKAVLQNVVRALASSGVGLSGDATLAARQPLLVMSALAGMPAATDALGVAVMNTLLAIAEVSDDAAFLARARRRLFPTLDLPAAQQVRAVQDWVMFRRARTHLCGPVCAPLVVPAVEAFQVWHLRLETLKDFELLKAALDKGDPENLARFKFQRVGILRFRDESSFAEESAERVLAMWRLAAPAPQVVLGRVWESAPATGQGWQNHFRLRNMLQQIASLTRPPAAGEGALAAIPQPPPPLADGALDGGLLVVSAAAGETRNALLIYGNWDAPNHYLNKEAPRSPLEFADNTPQGAALANFIASLNVDQPVRGVTLATTKAAPDAGAPERLKAVVEALVAAGRPAPAAARQVVQEINAHDRGQLTEIGLVANDYDEVIFFELNAG